jgi:hypothetical protein
MLFDFLFNRKEKDSSIIDRIDNHIFDDKEIENLVKSELKLLTLGELVDHYFDTRCQELSKVKPKTRKKKLDK